MYDLCNKLIKLYDKDLNAFFLENRNILSVFSVGKINESGTSSSPNATQRESNPAFKLTKNAVSLDSPLDTFMLLRAGEKVQRGFSNTSLPVAMVPPRMYYVNVPINL